MELPPWEGRPARNATFDKPSAAPSTRQGLSVPDIELLRVTPVNRAGNTRAFVKVRVGDFTFTDCKIVQQPGQSAWLAWPSREYTASDGMKKWAPIVEVAEPTRRAISDRVVELWEAQR